MSELALLTVEVLVASIAILALVAALLYFVFSEVRTSRTELRRRLATIETTFQQWAPVLGGIPDILEKQRGNPNGRRQELLTKWKLGTLTYDQSVELRDILASEAAQADAAMKTILGLALLALFIYALSKSIK
jgi:hypothetical protein